MVSGGDDVMERIASDLNGLADSFDASTNYYSHLVPCHRKSLSQTSVPGDGRRFL
jgi:hypothetical protein